MNSPLNLEMHMTAYFVATRARYVVINAENETQAREVGQVALHELYADLRERLGREVPIDIHTVRPATTDEIDMTKWHNETVEREALAHHLGGAGDTAGGSRDRDREAC